MTPFHLRGLIHRSGFGTRLGKTLHRLETQFGVAELTAAEADGHLHAVAVLQKANGVTHFGVEIPDVGVETETDFLDLRDMLIFTGFLLALRLFEPILTVVHDTANGRDSVRRDLHQIQIVFIRDLLSISGGHNAHLLTVGSDHTDFGVADLFIDLQFLACDGKAPPFENYKTRAESARVYNTIQYSTCVCIFTVLTRWAKHRG